ncbi:hypothetical protein [Flavobacterium sp. F52]|uniref:hypothetical protein n=1 Tax=Flavobacterium sp. F52 TaxID=1202532 RepID=UPI000272DFD9|nr:hypothetical protein [Flavobacterium sp. F52]EJG02289.1 hypothetical protein FF52_06400 [Flavobacterium sp. F52]
MKLNTTLYVSPIITEGKFDDVYIEDTSYQLDRNNSILRINFEMYYFRNDQRIVISSASLAFQGMNDDEISTNVKTLFKYTDSNETHGLIQYFIDNEGAYPENSEIVEWGFPSFEDALTYLDGGSFQSPELFPKNDFVRDWILNSVVMKGEAIGQQFQFVQ